jgi:hypothetical protein
MRRFLLGICVAVIAVAAGGSSASAAVTIGQLAPGSSPPATCSNPMPYDMVQPSVTSGASYVVPGTGPQLITSWSTNAGPGAGQTLALKVFSLLAPPNTFRAGTHDGPRPLAAGQVNTFSNLQLQVQPGDIIGLNDGTVAVACLFAVPGETHQERTGDLTDGTSGPFFSASNNRLNISAVVKPSNLFALGRTARNKKKGTATISALTPQPGRVTVTGKGVKGVAVAGGGAVAPAGKVRTLVRAKGKKLKTLNETGKVELMTTTTFTPTGGDPRSRTLRLVLMKK